MQLARTRCPAVHLRAKPPHGVAELANIQRPGQVRVCRGAAAHTASDPPAHARARRHIPGPGQARSRGGTAQRLPLPDSGAQGRVRIYRVRLAAGEPEGVTERVEERRQPLTPRDLRVLRALGRLYARTPAGPVRLGAQWRAHAHGIAARPWLLRNTNCMLGSSGHLPQTDQAPHTPDPALCTT
jgi:hypothetical protein